MKNQIIIFLVLLVAAVGCKDTVLDQTNPNQIAEGNFWNNEEDAYLALMGTYSSLQSTWLFNSDPYAGGAMRLEYISDNGYPVWGWMPLASLEVAEFTSTSWGNPETFSAAYDVIMRANRLISKVPEIEDIDQETADRMVAEAKTLRSTAYLQLAMTYSDVPLIEEPVSVEESNVPKSPREEVFNFIISDLNEASGDLPEPIPNSEWGRVSQGAALGMLARTHLYSGNYSEAASAAQEVIDLQSYSLYPDYDGLFSDENEINDEVIFPVTFERGQGGEGSNFAAYWGNGFIDFQRALPDLADAYYNTDGLPIDQSPLYNPDHESENRDPRFEATLVANGDTWKGEPVEDQDTYYQRKYAEEDNNQDHFDSPQDWYILRYAHVLLIRAEALVRSGSSTESEVAGLINQIRDRVDMPPVEDVEGTGLSDQELLEIVKHERRVETAFEGLRYFDIKRWGEIEEAYQDYNENTHGNYGPSMAPREWNDRYMKWPLPQGEVDANDQLDQHDGY